jgi:hypothetical protein
MDVSKLDDVGRRIRANIRNFLLVASPAELRAEREMALERGDGFKVACIDELIEEVDRV